MLHYNFRKMYVIKTDTKKYPYILIKRENGAVVVVLARMFCYSSGLFTPLTEAETRNQKKERNIDSSILKLVNNS